MCVGVVDFFVKFISLECIKIGIENVLKFWVLIGEICCLNKKYKGEMMFFDFIVDSLVMC